MRFRSLFLICTIAISGCAADPLAIKPAYTDHSIHSQKSCDQVVAEIQPLEASLAAAMKKQRMERRKEAVNTAIFGSIVAVATDTSAAEVEIARLKGERNAYRSIAATKNCMLPAYDPIFDEKAFEPPTYMDR